MRCLTPRCSLRNQVPQQTKNWEPPDHLQSPGMPPPGISTKKCQTNTLRAEILEPRQNLGSVFGRTDFSRVFIFGPPDFFADLVAGFFLLIFVGKSAQKNPPGKSPAKSSKIYTTKIPDIFLQRGRANKKFKKQKKRAILVSGAFFRYNRGILGVSSGSPEFRPGDIFRRREKTPTPKTRFSIWTLLRTPGHFTTRPLPVHFTTKMSVVRPFSVLSQDEVGP